MRMARVGVMGCGVVADYGHLPAIVQTPGLQLVGVFDPVRESAERAGAKFGAKAYTDQEAFLDSGLDAVVICSPVPFHRQNVLAAAERGLHVLCEKPLGMNDAEVLEMMALCESKGVGFAAGFVYRFSRVSQQIREWVRDGSIGEVRALRLTYLWELHGQFDLDANGEWHESPRWRGRMLEGGPMVDCGVHFIDLARWWLGKEVVRSHGVGAWVADGYEAPDHMWLHLDHEGGAHTVAEVSFSYGHTAKQPKGRFTYDVIGSGGTIRYERDGWIFERRNGEGATVAPGASEKDFPGLHAAFARALETGDWSEMPSAADGLEATRLARLATESVIAMRGVRTVQNDGVDGGPLRPRRHPHRP